MEVKQTHEAVSVWSYPRTKEDCFPTLQRGHTKLGDTGGMVAWPHQFACPIMPYRRTGRPVYPPPSRSQQMMPSGPSEDPEETAHNLRASEFGKA